MTPVVHLVIGPQEHGVVRHGSAIAHACGHALLRVERATDAIELPRCDVVHVPFTDRLFAPMLDDAIAQFRRLAAQVREHGAELSVTLHDLPHDESPLQQRRREVYREVIAAARGVVVNSRTELALVQDGADTVHSLRSILLPIEHRPAASDDSLELPQNSVAVLGFVFPDRGYEDVIAALPVDACLVALGRAAAGHDDLVQRYADLAGGRWHLTGYVPDDLLAGCLEAAAVPVAPNRRVTASASINTWLAHGRRPLVPDSPYSREVLADRPGSLRLYDPTDASELAGAIASALADPSLTRLADDVPRGPSLDAVAQQYAEHLEACSPPRARVVGGHVVVPGNRWDLVPSAPSPGDVPAPAVSVVVPYFDAQHQLDLVLAALRGQTYPVEHIEIIVADDGSPRAPDLRAADGVRTVTVRQPDEGFRAAAARNLGARQATGDVLVFLDADTVPEPEYLRAIVPRVAACPDLVAVGRRRHADLSCWTASDVHPWRADALHAGELDEPQWLRDAYAGSLDLLHADRRSYRHVISAVLAMSRRLFDEIGGFDERFTGYGGEDWDLAHRAWCAGAVFAHVPEAIAWHDGADWARRGDPWTRRAVKNQETATLATLLPDPASRGSGAWTPYPSIAIEAGRLDGAAALVTVRSALAAGADCGFWFAALDGPTAGLVLATPGVHLGPAPQDVLARAWCHGRLEGAADLTNIMALAEHAERHGEVVTPGLRLRSARAVARTSRWAPDDALCGAVLFGRHDRTEPVITDDVDVAATLRAAQRVNRS